MIVAAVALLVLTAAARAANADAEANIAAGLGPPPGSTSCHDVLAETNEALRRCELSSRGLDE
jgi:hypothetical protein